MRHTRQWPQVAIRAGVLGSPHSGHSTIAAPSAGAAVWAARWAAWAVSSPAQEQWTSVQRAVSLGMARLQGSRLRRYCPAPAPRPRRARGHRLGPHGPGAAVTVPDVVGGLGSGWGTPPRWAWVVMVAGVVALLVLTPRALRRGTVDPASSGAGDPAAASSSSSPTGAGPIGTAGAETAGEDVQVAVLGGSLVAAPDGAEGWPVLLGEQTGWSVTAYAVEGGGLVEEAEPDTTLRGVAGEAGVPFADARGEGWLDDAVLPLTTAYGTRLSDAGDRVVAERVGAALTAAGVASAG